MGRQGGVEYRTPLIRELPAQERPRERLMKYGASSLSNAELLAIILRTGAASESVLKPLSQTSGEVRRSQRAVERRFRRALFRAWPGSSQGVTA